MKTARVLALGLVWLILPLCVGQGQKLQKPEGSAAPHLLDPSPPVTYPPEAFKYGVEGKVIFEADLDAKGAVQEIRVTSVPKEGAGFREALQQVVSKWRFEPARANGKPVASTYRGGINFIAEMPTTTNRIYRLSSHDAFAKMQALLTKLGIPIKTLDHEDQVIITDWIRHRRKPSNHPRPVVDPHARVKRYRFQIFIPPWAEPARVHIGAEVISPREPLPPAVSLEPWLFDNFEKSAGTQGHAIPMNIDRRYFLAEDLLGLLPGSLDCRTVPITHLDPSSVDPPEIIPTTRTTPDYPEWLREEPGKAKLSFNLFLMEDGSVGQVTLIGGGTLGADLVKATSESLRLWRYRPARLGQCPIPMDISVFVSFDTSLKSADFSPHWPGPRRP